MEKPDVGSAISALANNVASSEIAHEVELNATIIVNMTNEVAAEAKVQISDSVGEVKDQLSQNLSDARSQETEAVQATVIAVMDDMTDVATTEIAETLADVIVEVQEHTASVVPKIQELISDINDGDKTIGEKVGEIAHDVGDIIETVKDGVVASIPDVQHDLSEGVHELFHELIDCVKKHSGELTQESYDILKKLVSLAIKEALDEVKENFGSIAAKFFKALFKASIFRK